MNDHVLRAFFDLPKARSRRRIDFHHAEIIALGSMPPQYLLVVTGTKPYMNMQVDLVPFVYIRQPDYWGIEVVGDLHGIGLPAEAPFTVSTLLAGSTGTHGVEIIGATRVEQLDVPSCAGPERNCQEWYAYHDRQPGIQPTLHVIGRCTFPAAGYTVEVRRHAPQGINPADLLLDRIVREPGGECADVVTVVEVHYREAIDVAYDTVTILPDGITLKVEPVV